MFHQMNGMIGFSSNREAQRDIIVEYVRKFVQQVENVSVGGCLRVVYRLGNRLAINYAILGEVHQAFNLVLSCTDDCTRVVASTFAVKKRTLTERRIGGKRIYPRDECW